MEDYPTEEELEFIEKWDGQRLETFLDYLETHWHWPDYFKRSGKKVVRLELHTGGWSGNEDIIEALHGAWNGMFWFLYWQKSTRGGHYYFTIPMEE